MSYSILNMKQDLVGILHGTTLNKVASIDSTIDRGARQVMLDVDPQETKRIVALANPIYDNVYDYNMPDDVKGNKIIDIRPQANRQSQDYFKQTYNRDFDYRKKLTQEPQFSVQFNTGIKTIRISDPMLSTGILVNTASIITDSGTWGVNGNASNLQEDNINYVDYGSSLSFDLSAVAGTGGIANSTFTAVDLSTHENQSVIFMYVYLPTASSFTNVIVKWGEDTSNYWTATATQNYQGNAFVTGWNLIGLSWKTASEVGSPSASSVGYVDAQFTYDSTEQTAVRINSVVSRLGRIWEIEYYSKYLFKNSSTLAFQEKVASDSDLVNLDVESYNLLLNIIAYYVAQEVQGYSATNFDAEFFLSEYNKGLARYKSMYKSEIALPQSTYYKKPNNNYNRWSGTRFIR